MKLARVVRTGGIWALAKPYSIVDKPPAGTIVQYRWAFNGGCDIYFPGVRGYAPMDARLFYKYFEDLDDEAS